MLQFLASAPGRWAGRRRDLNLLFNPFFTIDRVSCHHVLMGFKCETHQNNSTLLKGPAGCTFGTFPSSLLSASKSTGWAVAGTSGCWQNDLNPNGYPSIHQPTSGKRASSGEIPENMECHKANPDRHIDLPKWSC